MITILQIRAIFSLKNFIPLIIQKLIQKIFKNKNDYKSWLDCPIDYSTIENLFSGKIVLNGPFATMKYPNLVSNGSSLYPKLLGSYEKELHFEIKTLLDKNFNKVYDIGCAEGYYAIGFAIFSPKSLIYAFDNNQNALKNCQKMASLNKIKDRVYFGNFCYKETLLANDLRNSLVISDCEGYELDLFGNAEIINHLKETTILIETHDTYKINLSDKIKCLYKYTHNIKSIFSIDDLQKVKTYNYNEISSLNDITKLRILEEGRKYIQEWLILTPKSA